MTGADTPELVRQWDEVLTTKVADEALRAVARETAKIFAELRGIAVTWDMTNITYPTESAVVNEWIETGMVEGMRDILIRGLRRRFPGPRTEEVVAVVNTQQSADLLRNWADASYSVGSIDEFIAVMRG